MKKYPRRKKFSLLRYLCYKIGKYLPLPALSKFKLFSSLEWIFSRLAREQISKLYENNYSPFNSNTKEFLVKVLNKEDIVLDIGCGSGKITSLISPYCKNITGLDYNQKLIALAQQKYSNIKNLNFISEEISEFIKNNNKKYDLVVCSHLIEHIVDFEHLLKDLKKISSRLYIETPDFDAYVLNATKKKFEIEPTYTDDDHVYELNRDELYKVFNDYNFKILKEEFKHGVMRFYLQT